MKHIHELLIRSITLNNLICILVDEINTGHTYCGIRYSVHRYVALEFGCLLYYCWATKQTHFAMQTVILSLTSEEKNNLCRQATQPNSFLVT